MTRRADWNGERSDIRFTGDDDERVARRCHRSPNAAAAVAVRQLQHEFPQVQFVFRSFACSGARIPIGLLFPFGGIEGGGDEPLPPQLEQVNDFLAGAGTPDGDQRIDALIINIGGNDLGFGKVIQWCTNLELTFVGQDCDPQKDLRTSRLITGGVGAADPDNMGLDDLPRLYEMLDERLDGRLAGNSMVVRPRSVFLTGVPNPLAGTFTSCPDGPDRHDYERNLTTDEITWIRNEVYPDIVAAMRAGAAASGWTYVSLADAITAGICAPDPMFNRNADALRHQGSTGVVERKVACLRPPGMLVCASAGWVHPTTAGYAALAPVLANALREQLYRHFTPDLPMSAEPVPLDDLGRFVRIRMIQANPTLRPEPGTGDAQVFPVRPLIRFEDGGKVRWFVGRVGAKTVDVPVLGTGTQMVVRVGGCGPLPFPDDTPPRLPVPAR